MFTRRIVFPVRADSSAEFSRTAEGHFLPQRHAPEGCRREDAFITPEFSEAAADSYRDTAECAAARTAAGSVELLDRAETEAGRPASSVSEAVSAAAASELTCRRRRSERRGAPNV